MSHRVLDELLELRRRLEVLDADIAAARAEDVVDLASLRDLRQARDTLADRLTAKEEATAR